MRILVLVAGEMFVRFSVSVGDFRTDVGEVANIAAWNEVCILMFVWS